MQTDTIWAYEVENNDFIVIDGEVMGYVYSKEDVTDNEGRDWIHLDTVDDDGEHTTIPVGAFESVTIVASWEDPDEDE